MPSPAARDIPRSRLGNCVRPTAHIATTTGQVISLINDSTTTITGAECAQIERLIVRDHKFHAKRRTS